MRLVYALLLTIAVVGNVFWVQAEEGEGVEGEGTVSDVDVSFLDEEPGWNPGGVDEFLWTNRCTIERMDVLDPFRFDAEFRGRKPVVIREPTVFEHAWTKEDLRTFVRRFADVPTPVYHPFEIPTVGGRMSTLLEFFREWKSATAPASLPVEGESDEEAQARGAAAAASVLDGTVTNAQYCFDAGSLAIRPDLFDSFFPGMKLGGTNTTRRMCGYQVGRAREVLDEHGEVRADAEGVKEQCSDTRMSLGPSGTGLPFHLHQEVCSNMVIWGRKRWFLSRKSPPFNPKHNVGKWVVEVLPYLERGKIGDPSATAQRDDILECTLQPGEMMYVPPDWYHSTLNVGHTIAMAGGCGVDLNMPGTEVLSNGLSFPHKRLCGLGRLRVVSERVLKDAKAHALEVWDHARPQIMYAHFLLGQVEEAVENSKNELRERSGARIDMVLLHEVGFLRRRAGKKYESIVREARKHIERAISINPFYGEAYALLGHARSLEGDIAAAITASQHALKLDSGDFTTCGRLGGLLMRAKKPMPERARDVLSACIYKLSDELIRVDDRECARGMGEELSRIVDTLGVPVRAIGASKQGLNDDSAAYDSVVAKLTMAATKYRKYKNLEDPVMLHKDTEEDLSELGKTRRTQ